MEVATAAILAFLLAGSVSCLELVTSEYPRTGFFLRGSLYLWVYAAIYGLIALLTTVLIDSLIASGAIKIEGLGTGSLMVRAIAIGLCAKALLHIRLFNVNVASTQVPVGTETIVQIFEPWLLRTIELEEFTLVREFVSSRAISYPDSSVVKGKIKANLPLREKEKEAFLAGVDKEDEVIELMESYLRNFGRKTFNLVFPRPVVEPASEGEV